MPARAAATAFSPGRNFANSRAPAPRARKTFSVRRTQESGSSESAHSHASVRWPRRRPREYQNTSAMRSEEHTSELQSRLHLVCRLLLEKKKKEQHRVKDEYR